MNRANFLLEMDELLELEQGTLQGNERLADLAMWDSMTVLGFIALVDEQFGFTVAADRLAECQTVNDLIDLLDGRVTSQ